MPTEQRLTKFLNSIVMAESYNSSLFKSVNPTNNKLFHSQPCSSEEEIEAKLKLAWKYH